MLPAAADRPAVQDKPAPETLEDLREIEAHAQAVVAAAAPATVALDMGRRSGTGSGVIVSEDGYILTAAHVIGDADRQFFVHFPDGTTATAKTLGSDRQNDMGMAKLNGDGPWPFVPMAEADALQHRDWVVALGHPGGYKDERPVVARLGRVIRIRRGFGIQTDCSLIGGDSGGPLLNLQGQVVGIHSKIGQSSRSNMHVAVDDYRRGWDRMVAGEQWFRRRVSPLLGVFIDTDDRSRGVLVQRVVRGTPADDAGIRKQDIILRLDDQVCRDQRSVHEYLALLAPGDPVTVTLLRDGEEVVTEVTLAAREDDS